jgi:hypothetical protein
MAGAMAGAARRKQSAWSGATRARDAAREATEQAVKIGAADLECENRDIDPVERLVRPQYEASFRKSNRRLIARVRPAAGRR